MSYIYEGLVHESSLNPYLAAINQAHEDIGLPRPAAGHSTTLLRRGFRDAEGEDFDEHAERAIRAPVPAEAIYAIMLLGLATSDQSVLRMCLHCDVLLLVQSCRYRRDPSKYERTCQQKPFKLQRIL